MNTLLSISSPCSLDIHLPIRRRIPNPASHRRPPPGCDVDLLLLLVWGGDPSGFVSIFLAMADSGARRQPTFTKVEQLRPGTHGHNLVVKVVDSKMVVQRGRPEGAPQGRQMRIAECLVGDETGMIVFTARNEQVDVMKPGTAVELRNAKIDMFKGSMRLAVDKWGIVKVAESPAEFTVKEDNNLSLIEFELVTVVE